MFVCIVAGMVAAQRLQLDFIRSMEHIRCFDFMFYDFYVCLYLPLSANVFLYDVEIAKCK